MGILANIPDQIKQTRTRDSRLTPEGLVEQRGQELPRIQVGGRMGTRCPVSVLAIPAILTKKIYVPIRRGFWHEDIPLVSFMTVAFRFQQRDLEGKALCKCVHIL